MKRPKMKQVAATLLATIIGAAGLVFPRTEVAAAGIPNVPSGSVTIPQEVWENLPADVRATIENANAPSVPVAVPSVPNAPTAPNVSENNTDVTLPTNPFSGQVGENGEIFTANQLEIGIFNAVNAERVRRGHHELQWDNNLSAAARWLTNDLDLLNRLPGPGRHGPEIVVITMPIGDTSVATAMNLILEEDRRAESFGLGGKFAVSMGETPILNDGMDRPSATRASFIGIGYNPVLGVIVIDVVSNTVRDVINSVSGYDWHTPPTTGGWISESPYLFAFYREHNPYNLDLLTHDGYTDEQIVYMWGQEMLRLSNLARSFEGASPLQWDERLVRSAQNQALDQNRRSAHIGHDGSNPWDRAWRENWPRNSNLVRENFGSGFTSPAHDVGAWLTSNGHRITIMDPRMTHFGSSVIIRNLPHPRDNTLTERRGAPAYMVTGAINN
ncbi:MAG: CAP domain-containing protein [Defluviitaleaceae bacterium]|nr:CAP domain-containing protein [Defluviitaleaceae bacterium]